MISGGIEANSLRLIYFGDPLLSFNAAKKYLLRFNNKNEIN